MVIKQVIHKGFSILLAILVLFSTVFLTIEKQFCGEVLVDVSIFSDAKHCAGTSPKKDPAPVVKIGCCKSDVAVVQGQHVLALNNSDTINLEQPVLFAQLPRLSVLYSEERVLELTAYSNYVPPTIIVDIQLLNDTFLI